MNESSQSEFWNENDDDESEGGGGDDDVRIDENGDGDDE